MFNVPAAAGAAQLGRKEQAARYVEVLRRRVPFLDLDSLGSRFKDPLGQKIEAVEGIVAVRLSLVARCAAIGLMQLRIADLPIFVLGCCELHSQKQAQLKVGAFEPQPSVYQN
jgi:hypothetical protein